MKNRELNLIFVLDAHSDGGGSVLFYIQRGDPLKRIGPFIRLKDKQRLFDQLPQEDRLLLAKLNNHHLLFEGRVDFQFGFSAEISQLISNHRNLFVKTKRNGTLRRASEFVRKSIATRVAGDLVEHTGQLDFGVIDVSDQNQLKLFWQYKNTKRRIPYSPASDSQNILIKTDEGCILKRDIDSERELLVELGQVLNIDSINIGNFSAVNLTRLSLLKNFRWKIIYKGKISNASAAKFNSSGVTWFDSTAGESKVIDYDSIIEAYLRGRRTVEIDGNLVFLPSICDADLSEEMALRVTSGSSEQIPFYKLSQVQKQFSSREHIKIQNKLNSLQFVAKLRNYQLDGVLWLSSLHEQKLGGLLADEMGLGKTVQTLAFIALKKLTLTLIVAPASVIPNWEREIVKFLPSMQCFVDKMPSKIENGVNSIYIISYQRALRQINICKDTEFDILVLDEGQFVKNTDTKAAIALRKINAKMRLVLTGTPIENSVIDLWAHLTFVNSFLTNSLNGLKKRFSKLGGGKAALELSMKAFSPLILRRTKSETNLNLPPLIERVIYCEMGSEQRKVYEATLFAFRRMIASGVSARVNSIALEALLRLRQCCSYPLLLPLALNSSMVSESCKLDVAYRMLEDDFNAGRKTIVFSQFSKVLDAIESKLLVSNIKTVRLDGSTKNRSLPVKLFQENNGVRVFLISFRAGGFGLNLTAAESIILFDPWWNPAAENQAFARAHRIGQDKTVLVSKLICSNTIEEKMLDLVANKSDLAMGLMNLSGSIDVEEIIKIIEMGGQ